MIVKVRIAPREQWGEWHNSQTLKPGDEVEIETTSCAVDPPGLILGDHPPGNKWWLAGSASVEKYSATPRHKWVCEHLLEMD